MNAVDELNFLLGIGPPRPRLPVTLQKSGYTSVRALGKGSFGQAFLVFHRDRGQYYVVKHVNMTNMNTRQRKDAHNEITVLQQLNHPNIVRYAEFYEEHPHLYIVMEYADGGDLYGHLEKIKRHYGILKPGQGLLTEPQVINLFVQIVMAVKHMHDRRLLHRDIKSQNVFLTKNHIVKLGDFGITTVLQNTVAMASTMCGTPCYFSPELCQGKPYNNKSDVWALGALLYELCANRLPFESTTMKVLMREIVNKQPRRIPPHFSNSLWTLVEWMLNKDPRERPDVGQVLLTPVLMKAVPDIISQLRAIGGGGAAAVLGSDDDEEALIRQARSAASSPQKYGRKPSGVDGAGAVAAPNAYGNGNGGATGCIADSTPYQQLLEVQQRQQKGESRRPSDLRDVPAAAAAARLLPMIRDPDGAAQSEARGRARGDGGAGGGSLHSNRPGAVGRDRDAAVAAPDKGAQDRKPPAISPGLRAALDIRSNASGSPNANQSPPVTPTAQAPPSASGTSISELLARFDQEKRRISERKESSGPARDGHHSSELEPSNGQSSSAGKQRPSPTPPARKLPHHAPDAAVGLSPGAAAASAVADSEKRQKEEELFHCNNDKRSGGEQSAARRVPAVSGGAAPSSNQIGAVLSEMSTRFHEYQRSAVTRNGVKDGGTGGGAVSPAAPQDPAAATPSSGASSADHPRAQDFTDPAGATLDVAQLQEQREGNRPPPHGFGGSVNARAIVELQRTLNTKHQPSRPEGRSAAVSKKAMTPEERVAVADAALRSSPVSHAAPPNGKDSGDCNRSDGAALSPRAVAQALLTQGAINVIHAVAGSMNDGGEKPGADAALGENGVGDADDDDGGDEEVPFTGSCLCGSVQAFGWLSAIYGSFICSCDVCCRTSGSGVGVEWLHLPNVSSMEELLCSSPGSAAAGGGASAVAALAERGSLRSYNVRMMTAVAAEDGAEGGGSGAPHAQYEASYTVFFCGTCGCLNGMLHDDMEGMLLCKTMLDALSQEVLARFARSVVPED